MDFLTEKNVLITVRGEQYYDGADPDETELVTDGVLSQTEEGWRLSYQESDMTGMLGTTTTFDVLPDRVILRRSGGLNSEMIFEKGKPHSSLYALDVGALTVDIHTDYLFAELDEDGGAMDIRYQIAVEHQVTGTNRFLIQVKTK